MSYEFTDEEAEKMWIFGNQIMIFSSAIFLIGLFGLSTTILIMIKEPISLKLINNLIAFAGTLGVSLLLFRPSDNFKKISVSEGRDIEELMEGLKEFNFGFLVISIFFILTTVLAMIQIIIGD